MILLVNTKLLANKIVSINNMSVGVYKMGGVIKTTHFGKIVKEELCSRYSFLNILEAAWIVIIPGFFPLFLNLLGHRRGLLYISDYSQGNTVMY